MLKKLGNNLAWIIIGIILAMAGGVALASNLGVLNATQKGDIPVGISSAGNYQLQHPCANGQILAASSTATTGWACVANTAASGATTTITSNVLINGPNFIFGSGTPDTNIGLQITGSGTTITFQPTFTGVLSVARGGTGSSTLNTTLVAEGTNLYFTNARAAGAISLTTTGTSGASTYNQATGALNIPQYQAAGTYVTAVNGSTNINSTGGTTPTISIQGVIPSSNGGTGTTTLGSLTVGTNLSISGGQNVLIGTSTIISLGANVLIGGSGVNGHNTYWTGVSSLGSSSDLLDNGTVSGVNATSSTVNFTVKGTGTNNPFNVASSSGTSELIVTSAGNIGIASSSPVAPLSVVGNIFQNGAYTHLGNASPLQVCLGTCGEFVGSDNTTNGVGFASENTNGGASSFSYLTLNNNLLNPALTDGIAGLQFNSSIYNDTTFGTGFAVPNLLAMFTQDGPISVIAGSSTGTSYINFLTAGAATSNERVRITAAGKVGIGTSTPSNALVVVGSIQQTGVTNSFLAADPTGKIIATTTPSGGGGSGSGVPSTTPFTNGHIPYATSTLALTDSPLLTNGIVSGIGATSSTVSFNIQGVGGKSPFNIASSTGTSMVLFDQLGDIGLSNTSPDARIKIGNDSTQSVDAQIVVARNVDNTTGPVTTGNAHAFSDSSIVTRPGTIGYNSYDARTSFNGTSTFDHYAAFQGGEVYNSTGLMSNQYGFLDNPAINNTGNITNRYGFQAGDVTLGSTGAPANNFGFNCLADFTSGTTGNWCFYAGGQSNFMQGLLLGDSNTYYVNDKAPQLELTGISKDTKIRLLQSGQNYWDLNAIANSSRFGIKDINGTEYFDILTGGNVGIGTTTPSQKLVVVGSIQQTAATNSFAAFDATGKLIATTTPGGSGVTGGTNGKVAVFTSATTLGTGDLLDNLTVSGVNATSSTVNFNIQGTGSLNPFNVASSTGTSEFTINANGTVLIQPNATSSTAFLIKNPSGASTLLEDQTATFAQMNVGTTTTQNIATLYVLGGNGTSTADIFQTASSSGQSYFKSQSNGLIGMYGGLYGFGSTPTFATSTGAGGTTASSFTVTGTNIAGTLALTTATAPSGSAAVGTMTTANNISFPNKWICTLTPDNAVTALLSGVTMVYLTQTTNTFTVNAGSSGLTGATAYLWNYNCGGY